MYRACHCITRSLVALPVGGGLREAALRALQAGLRDAGAHHIGAMYLATHVPASLVDEVALLVVRTDVLFAPLIVLVGSVSSIASREHQLVQQHCCCDKESFLSTAFGQTIVLAAHTSITHTLVQ
jgi:hypothetical protein